MFSKRTQEPHGEKKSVCGGWVGKGGGIIHYSRNYMSHETGMVTSP